MHSPRGTTSSSVAIARAGTVLVALLLVAACDAPLTRNLAPSLEWSVEVDASTTPATVTIDTSGSHDPDGRIERREVRVDGATAVSIPSQHRLRISGPATLHVDVTVTDDDGATARGERTVTVPAPEASPHVTLLDTEPLEVTALVGQTGGRTLTLRNDGDADLAIEVEDHPEALAVAPGPHVAAPAASVGIDLALSCGPDPYATSGRLALTTNDPSRPVLSIEVHVECRDPPAPTPRFDVDLRFEGSGATAQHRAVFERAVGRWEEVIVGDLPPVTLASGDVPRRCGTILDYPGTVDDVLIVATLEGIDGPGGVLAQARPCLVRQDGGLAVVGTMTFDTDDLDANPDLEGVVLHEMGHILGIAPHLWIEHDLFERPYADAWACLDDPETPRLIGTNVVQANQALGLPGPVPVEDDARAGTGCAHFEEEVYGGELMTGFVGGGMSLSRLTAAALADVGHEVNYAAADPYALPGAALRSERPGPRVPLNEVLLPPRATVDERGRVVPLAPPG